MATGVVCDSEIETVTVYARGAVVRRRAALPADLPAGACQVVVRGVTPLADAGALRASLVLDGAAAASGPEGRGAAAREVLGVRAELVVPELPAVDASLAARVDELRREREAIVTARSHAEWRRELLASVQPAPDLVRRAPAIDPADRVTDALAIVGLVEDEMAALDATIAALGAELEENEREAEAARLRAAQATAMDEKKAAPPELHVVVQLGPARQGATPAGVDLEYTLSAARWWPAYRARFTEGATRAALTVAALVAQASGEDWNGVELRLSTGDLLRDARLPEATSMRLGRAQRPRTRGYRPPPEGLDAMFEGFDRFVAQVSVVTTSTTTVDVRATAAAPAWQPALPQSEGAAYDDSGDDLDMPTEVAQARDFAKRKKRSGAPPVPGAPGFGGNVDAARAMPPPTGAPPPAPSVAGPMPMAMPKPAAPMAPQAARGDRALFERAPVAKSAAYFADDREETTLGGLSHDAAEMLPIEPTDAWLDFDTLRLDPAAPRGKRGRLTREIGRSAAAAAIAAQIIERLEAPAGTTDPRASRGLFDVVYTASGTADVPSNGRPHRVTVITAEASAQARFVTVPREAPEVYRRAYVQNPFGVPLLTGPVEVLIDGALVALTRLSYTDRGGTISIGLGVEERVKVARTSRVEESSAGLLGGSTVVDHAVSTELASSLGRKIVVEVLDRLPVSDERDVEVKLVSTSPKPSAYSQAELGQPLRKGLRWEVEVPAGGKAKVEHQYRITLPSKMEIAGGNRRE